MRFYEHETKLLFADAGIPVATRFGVISSLDEFNALDVTYPLMLKAAVLIGGRGKAGGIKKVNDEVEARAAVSDLIGKDIRGYSVDSLLVEEAVEFNGACYLGVTQDPISYRPVIIASASGGVDIELVAKENPDAIIRIEMSDNEKVLGDELAGEIAEKLVSDLGETTTLKEGMVEVLQRLYSGFQRWDAKLLEINPLLISNGRPLAVDAKFVMDDNGMWRQSELLSRLGVEGKRHDVSEATENELRSQAAKFPYVDLLSSGSQLREDVLHVGLVPGGAGYGIFSIDEVANVGDRFFDGRVVPINFMDSGGGPPENRVAEMFHLLMDNPIVDLIITSRFGGISSCDVFIRGLVRAVRERTADGRRIVPIRGRMVGTDLPSARSYLEKAHAETPDALSEVNVIVGNQRIMADIIKEAVGEAFESRGWTV